MSVLLKSIEESSLISLTVKSSESVKKNPRLEDPFSIKVAEKIALNGKKYKNFFVHENMVAAATIVENDVKEFLHENPSSNVINLGCGYDNLFEKVDNGQLFWYDVDLPEIMEKREDLFGSGDRVIELEGDARGNDWTVFVSKDSNPLIVAQGFFFQFSKENIIKILDSITGFFSSGHLLCDLWSPWAMKKLEKKCPVERRLWGEGFESPEDFKGLNEKLKLEKSETFSSLMQNYGWKSRKFCSGKDRKDSHVALFSWGTEEVTEQET